MREIIEYANIGGCLLTLVSDPTDTFKLFPFT